MEEWSDAEICRGLREPERSRQAFRALHRRYGPRLLGFLVKRCRGDREQAEDLLGRTLYKAYRGLAQMEAPCRSLSSWLYTVAARTALDELARLDIDDPLYAPLPLNEDLARAVSDAAEEPSDAGIAVAAAVESVLEALEAENPRYRTLLEMEYVGACDRGEIAEATGITRKQVSQYLKRARERFVQLARRQPVLAALEQEAAE